LVHIVQLGASFCAENVPDAQPAQATSLWVLPIVWT
jgi:hypothetical protein